MDKFTYKYFHLPFGVTCLCAAHLLSGVLQKFRCSSLHTFFYLPVISSVFD